MSLGGRSGRVDSIQEKKKKNTCKRSNAKISGVGKYSPSFFMCINPKI